MVGKYNVIYICGSSKFKDDFIEQSKLLTLQGNIILSVNVFGHSGDNINTLWTDTIEDMLIDMGKRKVDMADEVFVINKNGYIGETTKLEIDYALSKGLPIRYLEEGNNYDILK